MIINFSGSHQLRAKIYEPAQILPFQLTIQFIMIRQWFVVGFMLSILFYFGCQNSSSSSETAFDPKPYLEKGNEVVARTFDTLSTSLKTTIQEKGVVEAIGYCNVAAYPLTATYAQEGIEIRRTTLRYRNEKNKPTSLEKEYLKSFEDAWQDGKELATKAVQQKDGTVHYFKPIMIQPLCLVCHGKASEQIQESTLAKLDELYPNDQARNYEPDQLRGLWHVAFKE